MNSDTSSTLVFFVNGNKIEEPNADPEESLMSYLRTKLKLCGTKNGCSEGGCGACTIMISIYDRSSKTIKHHSANACLLPVCALHGSAVTTVEGVGSIHKRIHPIQERLALNQGSQCGFCTPGFVMAMYALLRTTDKPSKQAIEEQLSSNLCRCTGYRPIIQSFYTFSENSEKSLDLCCSGNGKCPCKNLDANDEILPIHTTIYQPYDPTQEPIFPPELIQNTIFDQTFLKIIGQKSTWYRPVTLDELLQLKSVLPEGKIVIGNTSVGLIKKFYNTVFPVLINPTKIPELREVKCDTKVGITAGAALTWTELQSALVANMQNFDEPSRTHFQAVIEMIKSFDYPHLKNVASFIGNVVTASSMSDMSTIFLAIGAKLNVTSAKSRQVREISVDNKLFLPDHRTSLSDEDIVLSVMIPKTEPGTFTEIYKQQQGQHRVKVAFSVKFDGEKSAKVEYLRLSLAGVGRIPLLIECQANKMWGEDLLSEIIDTLIAEIPKANNGPIPPYRMSLYLGFFFKFYVKIRSSLEMICPASFEKPMLASLKSAAENSSHYEPMKAIQIFSKVPDSQKEFDEVGKAVAHQSGLLHSTGEAVYCDDVPVEDCLHLGLVQSSKAHARIKRIDTSEALKLPGVVGVVDISDVPAQGTNLFGLAKRDEMIFADKEVYCEGQLICAIAANSSAVAHEAAALVKVEYEELPAIITIEDAINADSYHSDFIKSSCGDVESALSSSENRLTGEFRTGGQEHFYLETQSAVVIPKENEFEVIASAQNACGVQIMTAEILGIPCNKVVAKIKRVGGAFGGKEGKLCVSVGPAAIAANKFKMPVKNVLKRDQDMKISGGRHPTLAKYEIGFTNSGLITALKIDVYIKGGWSADVTPFIAEVIALTQDGPYKIPNLYVAAHSCKTNSPSNTAFRGFGQPQTQLIREHMITAIAHKLFMDPVKVREANLYKEGEQTPFGQTLTNCMAKRCWNECLTVSNYYERRREVDSFNSRKRWIKRGVTAIPLKYSLGMPLIVNQGAALVHIYLDGSVLITHGGIEMGQGLHTKMIQIATRALQIPIDKIHISDSASDKVPNATVTAGSSGSDLYGGAVQNACEILRGRLEPIVKENPNGNWEDWVKSAYLRRISLSTTGYYKTDKPDPNFEDSITRDKDGNIQYRFRYFVYGAVCCEVEIDCLTGTHKVIRADLLMDLGESLNPAIDIGQIEGAFMQGYGLCTVEDIRYSNHGHLQTVGPRGYTIPRVKDTPKTINIHLLKDSKCPVNIYSSKGVGEPPLLLGTSALFAIQNAVDSARTDAGCKEPKFLDSPATAELIRMSCSDPILEQIVKKLTN